MTDEELDKINEALAEHNKSLQMLLDVNSKMADEMNALRGRVGDMEAKLAYYTQAREGLIQ